MAQAISSVRTTDSNWQTFLPAIGHVRLKVSMRKPPVGMREGGRAIGVHTF
jgi:hypothetical protein